MEYLPLGDLRKYIKPPLDDIGARDIIRQLLEGLVFMHENKFATEISSQQYVIAHYYACPF